VKKLVVIGGGNVGLAAALLHTLTASSVEAVIVESRPIEFKLECRRYGAVPNVVIKKPKQPNFAQFQNNFKRRGR